MSTDEAHLGALHGAVLHPSADDVLDRLVEAAAKSLDAPLALITFIVGRTQLWRAATGLPDELNITRATSKCDSYCQFVVAQDDTLSVTDNELPEFEFLPTNLTARYGIRSYLGVPLRYGDHTLGSFCVLDLKARAWTSNHEEQLKQFAIQAEERLEILSQRQPDALEPDIQSLAASAGSLQVALTELGPLLRLVSAASEDRITWDQLKSALGVLTELEGFYDELRRTALGVRLQAEALAQSATESEE